MPVPALVPAPVHIATAATNLHDPSLAPAPVRLHDTEGKGMHTRRRATRSVEDPTADGAPLDGIPTGQAAHAAAPARGRLSAEEAQIACPRGGVHRATSAEGLDVCADRGPGVILCAPVAPAQGRSHVRVPARDQTRIHRTRGIAGAGVGLGRLAGGGEATVGTTLGTAGPDRQRLCNTYSFLDISSRSTVLFSFAD